MNTLKTVAAGMLALLLAGPSTSVATETEPRYLGMVTGDLKGTAHQVGMDVKALLKRNNIHLAVFNSSGSVENIYAVYQRPGNHLGLVQSDVLSFVAKVRTDNRLKLIADKIRWVYPLYDLEVHVLSRAQVNDFGDLHDKRVAIGHLESDTYLTSRLLFEIAGIMPRQIQAIDHAPALADLKAGRIDAMIIVDGVPIERLALDVSASDNLKLIPITLDAIRAFYPASRIPAGTYPWQAVDVDTVSVKAVMVAYDFSNHHCRTIGIAAWLIRENLDWLRFNGHPKWRTVNLNASVKGWERYQCVADVSPYPIDSEIEPSRTRRPNPVADAIEAVFEP